MPISMREFEALVASKPQGTSLAEVLGVATVFWSGSLTEWIYLVPDVIGNQPKCPSQPSRSVPHSEEQPRIPMSLP